MDFSVARFTLVGNAKASKRGTSKSDSTLFLCLNVYVLIIENGIAMKDYLGWKYDYNQMTEEFAVIPNEKYQVPNTFFKYYALNENSVNALTNMYVYASHPNQLNDPFDCDTSFAKVEDEGDIKVLLGELYEQVKSLFGENYHELCKFATEAFSTIQYKKWGVLSLTDSCENPIMWPRYANNNGFCLEWDIKQFTFMYGGPFPIHYVKEIEQASSSNYDIRELVLIQCNIKRDCWKYEKEWRLMIYSPVGYDMKTYGKYADEYNHISDLDRKFKYPLRALKSITLGILFFKNLLDRQHIISLSPYEIHACYQSECLETQVLDFMEAVNGLVNTRLVVKDGLESDTKNIIVKKVSRLTYRITEL